MAYQPIVLPADLNYIYAEIITEITRDDGGALAAEAIMTAIQEVKMYLTRFDLVQIFGDELNDVAATFTDVYLTRMVKDIAIWHLMQLCTVGIEYEVCKVRYDTHIKSLKAIQAGTAAPLWPYQDTTDETAPKGDYIYATSNQKRNYHF